LALACVGLVACDDKNAADPHGGGRETRTTGAAPSAQAAGPAPLSADFVAKAREVQTTARAIAATCKWNTHSTEWGDMYYDFCAFKKAQGEKLHAAVTALGASGLAPETGPAASFVDESRMFDAFVANALAGPEEYGYESASSRSRGTLSHYQDLAFAWNAMLSDEKVPVDEGNTSYTLGPADSGAPRHWERCGGLPCVKRMHP